MKEPASPFNPEQLHDQILQDLNISLKEDPIDNYTEIYKPEIPKTPVISKSGNKVTEFHLRNDQETLPVFVKCFSPLNTQVSSPEKAFRNETEGYRVCKENNINTFELVDSRETENGKYIVTKAELNMIPLLNISLHKDNIEYLTQGAISLLEQLYSSGIHFPDALANNFGYDLSKNKFLVFDFENIYPKLNDPLKDLTLFKNNLEMIILSMYFSYIQQQKDQKKPLDETLVSDIQIILKTKYSDCLIKMGIQNPSELQF